MKCQILFSMKNKENISKCCLLKFYPARKVLRVNKKLGPAVKNLTILLANMRLKFLS